MLAVLLLILKIIGIVLLSLFLFLLFTLLLVLFVPIRYSFHGKKREEIFLKARISWLLRILSVSFLYEGEQPVIVIRIFGYTVVHTGKEKKEKKKKSKRSKRQENSEREEESRSFEKEQALLQAPKEQEQEEQKKEQPREETKKKIQKEIGHDKTITDQEEPKREKSSREAFSSKFSDIRGKFDLLRLFWQDEKNKQAIKILLLALKKIGKHILPTKLEGILIFGTGDPCTTGQILAIASAFYAKYGQHLTLCPDFEETKIEGELRLKGRIQVFHFVKVGILTWTKKEVAYFRKSLKKLIRQLRESE